MSNGKVTKLSDVGKSKKRPKSQDTKNKENIIGEAAPASKKGKGGILHMQISDAFSFKASCKMPQPDHDFRVYRNEAGAKVIYEVIGDKENRIANIRDLKFVTEKMVCYRRQHLAYAEKFCDWTYADHRECAKLWEAEVSDSPKPRAFGFRGDDFDCFHRMEFDLDLKKTFHEDIKPTPIWNELMGRTHNSYAMKAFYGSLLIEESYLQQYLYVFGDGGDGKGAMIRAIKRLFGAAAYSKQRGPRIEDKHYGVSFNNKRLVAFTDSRDPSVVRADYVMALTGDDGLEVEPKREAGYNIPPYCKLIFLSNKWPKLDNQASEIRRIILCWVDPRPAGPDGLMVDDPVGYEASLWAEMGDFLKQCLNAYHEQCPRHGMIPQSDEAKAKVRSLTVGLQNDSFQEFFEDNFVISPGSFVTVKTFNERVRREIKESPKRTLFKEWLLTTHKIVTKGGGVVRKFGDHTERVLTGLYSL